MAHSTSVSKVLLWSAASAGLFLFTRSQRKQQFDFRGKSVLITGGSRGLGLVLARQLASQGARVAICARDEHELELAVESLRERQAGIRDDAVLGIVCDLRDRDDVERMIARVIAAFGGVDVLVNNAGIITVGPLEEMTLNDFAEAMDSNFWSGVYTTMAVLPGMRSRRSGRIVNITSVGGRIAVPHLLPYSASKFAFTGFSRGLRSEVAKDGIVVTTIVPGLMRTGSPRQANFKGQNELEHAWFSIADSLPFLSMDAERAASQIIEATRRGDTQVTLTLPARLASAIDALVPEFSGRLLEIANLCLPDPGGIGQRSLKGFASTSSISPSILTTLGDQAATRNNEHAATSDSMSRNHEPAAVTPVNA